jgi:WD40 repeat protein
VITGQPIADTFFGTYVYNLAWHPDDFILLGHEAINVFITDITFQGNFLGFQQSEGEIYLTNAVWNPAGDQVAYSDISGTLRIWDVASDTIPLTIQPHTVAIRSLAWNPNGDTIASGDESGVIHIWKASDGEVVTTITTHEGAVRDLSWSPDGKMLASAGDDGLMRVWDARNGMELASYDYTGAVMAVDWSPAGDKIAFGGVGANGQSGELRIVDAPNPPR